MTIDKEKFFSELETLGEKEVREKIPSGVYGTKKLPFVKEWLRQQDELKEESRFSRIEEREEELLSIAREANEIAILARDEANSANSIAESALLEARESNQTARSAKNAAWSAAIAAIISAIFAAIVIYLKLNE